MSNQFPGLCIGGPLDGQLYTKSHQHFTIEERPPLKTALQASLHEAPLVDMPPLTTHDYTWTHIGPFALWLHESKTLHQALHDMAQAYQENTNGDRK